MTTKKTLFNKKTHDSCDPDDVILIGIDTEHKSDKEHPYYDKRIQLPLDEGLVRNIMVYGIIDDVKVCKDGEDFVVVDGRQRVRAAREANKRLVKEGKEPVLLPVKIKRGTEATLYGVMVSANECRQDDEVLLKAEKAQRMLDMGKSQEEIAIAFHVTPSAVTMWLQLLEVSSDVRKAVEEGKISPTAAAKLSPLNRDEQKTALKELIEAGTATVAHVEARVRATREAKTNGTPVEPLTANPPLGKKAILKLVKHCKGLGEEYISADILKGMRLAIGDLAVSQVANLTALLEESRDIKLRETKEPKVVKRGGGKKAGKKGGKKAPPRINQKIGG